MEVCSGVLRCYGTVDMPFTVQDLEHQQAGTTYVSAAGARVLPRQA